jgi:hypothetical protein
MRREDRPLMHEHGDPLQVYANYTPAAEQFLGGSLMRLRNDESTGGLWQEELLEGLNLAKGGFPAK